MSHEQDQQRRDQQIIDDLFDRIESVARTAAPRDPAAEASIQRRLRDFPAAPYYLAQTVVAQEQALRDAQTRIAELEGKQRARGPWDRDDDSRTFRAGQQGGFLAGAAQTALGVAGGMMLINAFGGLFHSAQATEIEPDSAADQEHGGEADSGDADMGGDFGDGGFDIGGDF